DKPIFADVWAGLEYVARHPRLRLVVSLFVLVILAGFPHVTVLPGLVENVYRLKAADVSSLFVASAIGALTASLFVARFASSPRSHWIYTGHGVLFGAALVGLAFWPSFEYLMFGMFLVGYGSGGFQSLNSAVIAHYTEVDYIGRVMSLVLLAFAGFGLMSLPYGFLADRWGEPATLLLMGCAVLGLCAVFSVLLVRRGKDFAEA
ncbi:MFS transporter, partial [Myxococcota bacterium]|nr:MFS transporter [Myxococcota bacterium]